MSINNKKNIIKDEKYYAEYLKDIAKEVKRDYDGYIIYICFDGHKAYIFDCEECGFENCISSHSIVHHKNGYLHKIRAKQRKLDNNEEDNDDTDIESLKKQVHRFSIYK
jgi:uncharacterized ferredoxin-like protein